MTRRELLLRMDSAELSEWIAFNHVEPFGDEWRQTGLVAAVTANTTPGTRRAHTPEDFMPNRNRAPQPQTLSQAVSYLAAAGIPIVYRARPCP